ncbi:H-NS histone family protein [Paraburkholderia sp. RL18-103-BIB-C]|uniref:H-NS histone family protein n=1 Tax=Paraburkholderia sp. RL18-103-BIB-C TaxID=3031637 RepID=UPI0038BBF490
MTLRQLIEQRDAIDAQIADLRAQMYAAKLAEVKATIDEFGFTAFELGLVKTQHIAPGREHRTFAPQHKAAPRPPLYRDPASGQTWAGRGRPPMWIDGENRDEYLINGPAS